MDNSQSNLAQKVQDLENQAIAREQQLFDAGVKALKSVTPLIHNLVQAKLQHQNFLEQDFEVKVAKPENNVLKLFFPVLI